MLLVIASCTALCIVDGWMDVTATGRGVWGATPWRLSHL